MTKIINLASTGIQKLPRMSQKARQQSNIFGLFVILSLALIRTFEAITRPNIFLMRANKHIQKINQQFDVTLNHFGNMIFVANQQQNKTYKFKEMLLQPNNSEFIMAMLT